MIRGRHRLAVFERGLSRVERRLLSHMAGAGLFIIQTSVAAVSALSMEPENDV
jgi:hypothetical protein